MVNIRSTRRVWALLAIFTFGIAGCDKVTSTQEAIAGPGSLKHIEVPLVYTSGPTVMTWDPIVETYQPDDWTTQFCKATPLVGRDANWQNPHTAFVVDHPWVNDYFYAPWINAWNHRESYGSGGTFPYYNWTKYQTQVEGNGSFVIRLLADNCSWIYLDGTLVGVQGTNLAANSYGLTLNGTHTLEFIIFDGGGASGGKFRLETTTNPPPPLNNDLDNDGHPNNLDAFPLDPTRWSLDTDGDGVDDSADNCPAVSNSDQADLDHDGVGDVCDPDIDGDGFANGADAFPTNSAEWADSDGDGFGDNADAFDNSNTGPVIMVVACNTGVANRHIGNGTWANDLIAAAYATAANHGKFVSAVANIADGWKKAGHITGREQGAIVSCAARTK